MTIDRQFKMNNILDNELADLCESNNLLFGALQEIINRLGTRVSSQNPLCFHKACGNEKVTLAIVQLLYNTLPEAFRLRDDYCWLPIHRLCRNKDLDDTNSIDILRFMLNIDPTLPREVSLGNGCLPVQFAVANKSTIFCKILIDAYPDSLQMGSDDGWLPIHDACANDQRVDTADTIQYMLEVDPELVNAERGGGYLPIHLAATLNEGTKSIELLLKYDPDAASKETNNGSHRLPLHRACAAYNPNLTSIQLLYDAYPEAIFARDRDGRTPVDIARSNDRNQPTIKVFLQTQLEYFRQAQDMTFMTTVDGDGWLPLHRALKDDAPLGSIKLLIRGNRAALQVAGQNGVYPVHIACEFSSKKVVWYLVELAEVDTLNSIDANNNSPLHYACRGGNYDVLKYLLEANVPSVSDRNNDNKLAIHLLFECGEETHDRESMEYVETIYQLLLANPEVVRDFMSY